MGYTVLNKEQTYGIEIEMYHMSREGVAKHVSSYYKTGRKPYKKGMFRNRHQNWATTDDQGREWLFKVDGSIKRYNAMPAVNRHEVVKFDKVCELITPPLTGDKDLNDLCGIVEELIRGGAHSNAGMKCSLHIHLGLMDHTAKSLTRLAHLHAMVETRMIKEFGISQHRIDRYCQKTNPRFLFLLDMREPQTIKEFQDIWYEAHGTEDKRYRHYNKSRYHLINFHAITCHGTIEFRGFQFRPDLNTAQLRQYLNFCMRINEYSKTDLPLDEFKF